MTSIARCGWHLLCIRWRFGGDATYIAFPFGEGRCRSRVLPAISTWIFQRDGSQRSAGLANEFG